MNWMKIWAIIRHEYVTNIRRTGFIVMTLIVPAVGLLSLGLSAFVGKSTVAVLDRLFGPSSQTIAVVDESGYFQPILPDFRERFVLYPDRAAARAAVDEGDVSAALFIPGDYVQTGKVYVYSTGGDMALTTLSESESVRSFFIAHLARNYVPDDILARLSDPVSHFVSVEEQGPAPGPLGFVFTFLIPYFFAILLIISVFISSGYLLQGIAEEKENRLVELVLSSVSPLEWFVGKVIGLGAVGLTQLLIWVISVGAISGGAVVLVAMSIPSLPVHKLLILPVFYLLGYVLYAVLYAGLGALGTNHRESQQVAGIISFIAAVPFMVSGVLFTNPNSPIIRALTFFPLTAASMIMLRLPMSDVPTTDMVISLISLVVSIPLAAWLGAKLFRMGILMYGKRPSFKEVWAALRAA